ncbi:NADH:ubiquinone reductase (Na(+)-transporting) subunit B [Crocinitomix catalasitica]|nr:NADH:ubiquinone reductase (Na(+)-transporting) subunit B [Crocinitomix catalasitica]
MEKLLRKFEPEHDGKWAKLHPVWDGFYTFLFTPGETTQKGAHIRDGIDLKRTMFMVIVALTPCLLFGIYNTGHWHYMATGETTEFLHMFGDKVVYGLIQVLPIVIVSYGVGLGVEFAFCIKNGHAIQEGFLVSGMLIPLIVPADVPLWMVAVATVFAVVIGKEVFGGTGMNIVNVALTARAFLFFGYPTMMSGDKVWVSGLSELQDKGEVADGFSGATPLGELATFASDEPVFSSVAAFSEKWTFMDSFYGFIPGSIGETSVIAIGLGAVLLLYTRIASWKVMISFILGGLGIGILFNAFPANPFMELDPLFQMCLGGFAFGAVFMATDPVTACQTSTGKYIYGLCGGAFAILVRVFNPAFPEGVMMAILFMNIMAPMIDHYVVQSNIKRRLKRLKTSTNGS